MKTSTILLYALARLEVTFGRRGPRAPPTTADRLDPRLVPSVAAGDWSDRVLGEIDQDGAAFAADPRDRVVFGGTGAPAPRKCHRLEIILANGSVWVRKSLILRQHDAVTERIRQALNWDFYLEAAALRRLHGCPGVPAVGRIDRRRGAIEMEYVRGSPLQTAVAAMTTGDEFADGVTALLAEANAATIKGVIETVGRVIDHGVVPRDLHPANFLRGRDTGTLHLVDFNLVSLRPLPGSTAAARRVKDLLRRWLTARPQGS